MFAPLPRSCWKTAAKISICLALTACGDSASTDENDAAEPDAAQSSIDAAPDAAIATTKAHICNELDGLFVDIMDKFLNCNPEFRVLLGEFPDRAALSEACDQGVVGPYIDDETIVLGDSQALAACRDWVTTTSCDLFDIDDLEACEELLGGTIATDAACDEDLQCAGDAYCDDDNGTTCGFCKPRLADDAACKRDDECQNGRCIGTDGIVNGMCGSKQLVGGDCSENDDCLGKLTCNETTQKCQTPQVWMAGDACSDGGHCLFGLTGLYCNESAMQCTAFVEVNGACDPNPNNGMLCNILQYETCVEGTCAAATVVARGEACGFALGKKCGTGDRCDARIDEGFGAEGVCVKAPEAGDSCVDDIDCTVCITAEEDCNTFLLECGEDNKCQWGNYTGMCPAP